MDWLRDFLGDDPSAESLEHVRAGLRIWLRGATHARRDRDGVLKRPRPVGLGRCMGLPENPWRARLRLRDACLREVAQLIGFDPEHAWNGAQRLHAEIELFMSRRWPCWRHLSVAPAHGDPVNKLLFEATCHGGGSLPGTARRLLSILNDA